MTSLRRFLGWPTRGGTLTILNCLLWASFALGEAASLPLLKLPALVAWWPVAWLFLLTRPETEEDLVLACIMVGVNSLLWGYGISWLRSAVTAIRRRAGPESARRGFEVITPTSTSAHRNPDDL